MASSTLVDLIYSAYNELELLLKGTHDVSYQFAVNIGELLRFWLGNIKLVLLLASKFGINLNPSSLLKTEDELLEIAEKIHTCYRNSLLDLVDGGFWLDGHLEYLSMLTKELSAPLLDAPRKSSSFTVDEVMEFISFSLDNLKIFQDLGCFPRALRDAFKSLGEQKTFLKFLILFVIQRNVEPSKDLVGHAGAVALDAAFIFFDDAFCDEVNRTIINGIIRSDLNGSFVETMLLEVSTLMQKIKPIHPHICKIYIEALHCSKLASRSLPPTDHGTYDETRNLFSSLVCVFFEELAWSTHVAVAIKLQLQELYEGLRFLRQAILKQQPKQLDMKTKQDFVNLVCDAGVFICSFQQTHAQTDLSMSIIQELLDAIKIILSSLGEKHAHLPIFNSRSTTQLAFIDFLSERLMELTSDDVEPIAESWAQSMRRELVFMRSFLGDIVDLPYDLEKLQTLRDRILEVAYRVEDVFDCLLVGNLSYFVSESFYSIMKVISTVKLEVEVMKRSEIKVKKESTAQIQVQPTTPSMAKQIIGFDDHATSIINRLKRGSKNLRIVAIVGMAGLGKTTLAEKIYNDPTISHHFLACAFTTISQKFDKKTVIGDLIKQVDSDKYAKITSKKSEHDAADQLRRCLKGKRYLIVLDDIWEARAWQQLQDSFPDDFMGSRIVFTSRHNVIAPSVMLDNKPFELGLLNQCESLNLLQMQLFVGNSQLTEISDILKRIVEVCNGLPLTIVMVAGVLRSLKQEDWKTTVDSLTSDNLSEHCKDTLELSYRYLPEHLKPCLLYFAAFQDQQISVQKLLSLWMAEGLVRKVEKKCQTDVAEGYLNDLIGRNLLMVAKKTSMGRVRCRIHALLYEFCSKKAKEEQFFHFLEEGYGALSGLSKSRRLCISSDAKDFVESKLFFPQVRYLRLKYPKIQDASNVTLMMVMCKLLRVLDLEHIYLNGGIPNEIGQLVRLAYLAFTGFIREIPTSLGNLSVLETLKITLLGDIEPLILESVWNLQRLKHLSISSSRSGHLHNVAILSMKKLDNSSDLNELHSVSGVNIPYDAVETVLNKFPNLRHLKFHLRGFENYKANTFNVVIPDGLTQLESLLVYNRETRYAKVDFSLPTNLKQLTLHGFHLSGKSLSSIGILPNLKYLRLIEVEFEGNKWIMEEEQFSKLRILKLNAKSLRLWSGSDNQFECLEKLVLSYCGKLEEMPNCLETLSTLQLIKTTFCPRTVAKMVQDIGKVQAEYGNSEMKIIISDELD